MRGTAIIGRIGIQRQDGDSEAGNAIRRQERDLEVGVGIWRRTSGIYFGERTVI